MKVLWIVAAAAWLVCGLEPGWASAHTKKTRVTFNVAVQVPGAMLPAGTYVFKLMQVSANRHLVQITNLRGTRVYATILAIPDYRISASSKTVMYFTERGRNTPMAVKSWFYPGDNYGDRFVYPRIKAMEIALMAAQPVPALDADVTMEAPVKIVMEKKEVAYVQSTFEKYDAIDIEGVEGEPVKDEPAARAAVPPARGAPAAEKAPTKALPRTASPAIGVGLAGLILLGVSALARLAAERLR